MPSGIEFEQGRLYVEPRHSVLFFARIGEQRLRCYITRDALAAHFGAKREIDNAYKYCLRAYDRNAEAIHEIARQLVADKKLSPEGAIVISPEIVEGRHVAQAA